MRRLVFVATEFQIINAINLKLTLFKNDDVDIVVASHHKDFFEYYNRLQQLHLFVNTYYVPQVQGGIHEYFRGVMGKGNKISFLSSIKGEAFLATKVLHKWIRGQEAILLSRINGYIKGDYKKYDHFLASCGSELIEAFYILLRKNGNCEISILDEGFGIYSTDSIDGDVFGNLKADSVYIYDPNIYIRNVDKIVRIPRLSKECNGLIEALNFVFDWQSGSIDFLHDGIIFFEQGWPVMPKYLLHLTGLKKILLKNSYRKHLNDQLISDEQKSLMLFLMDGFADRNIWIKFHPRSQAKFEYLLKNNVVELESYQVPWEVQCCNMDVSNNIFITICSSAVCLYEGSIGVGNNKYIFLFKLCKHLHLHDTELEVFQALQAKYSDVVYIPETLDEFYEIVYKLLNKDGGNAYV